MTHKKSLSIFFILLFFHLSSKAADIRGFVYNQKNGEPLEFSSVVIKGTSKGSSTNLDGFFSINNVDIGTYTLVASNLGFEKQEIQVVVKSKKDIVKQNFKLKNSTKQLKQVNISSKRKDNKNKVKVSVQKITPKEIKNLPSIGGDPDLAQYIQVLPGVVFTGDQGGQLYIRGGSPIQNKVILDGMTIYNPFHFIGLFSVFDTEILKSVDVYTGGFNAQYGTRLSSIIDLKTKNGNNQEFKGFIGLSSFNTKIQLEGPIKRPKKNTSSISYILSLKSSHISQSSKIYKPLFEAINTENSNQVAKKGLPYNFLDIYGKINIKAPSGSSFNLAGFRFSDKVNFSNSVNLGWESYGGSGNFLLLPPTSKALIKGVVAYSSYGIEQNDASNLPKRSDINGFNINMNLIKPDEKYEARYGFAIDGFSTNFEFFNAAKQKISQTDNNTQLALYAKYRFKFNRLIISPGFRFQYYASLSEISPEPRIGMKYNLGKENQFRLKMSGGLYSQNIIAANSEVDILNLFYGFISGPQSLSKTITKENGETVTINSKIQKATHLIAGFEYDLPKNVDLNVEFYYKRFGQLININNQKIYPDLPQYSNFPDRDKKNFIIETGKAYGMDVTLSHKNEDFSVWLVYSLSKTTRWNGRETYPASFDRRQNINALFTYTFGENRNWNLSIRWNFGTGLPFTQNKGNFEKITLTQVNQNIYGTNGSVSNTYGSLNGGRIPTYHRLDASIKKFFLISNKIDMEASLSVTNIYNRSNIFYINPSTKDINYQLPLMPSLGLNLKF